MQEGLLCASGDFEPGEELPHELRHRRWTSFCNCSVCLDYLECFGAVVVSIVRVTVGKRRKLNPVDQ